MRAKISGSMIDMLKETSNGSLILPPNSFALKPMSSLPKAHAQHLPSKKRPTRFQSLSPAPVISSATDWSRVSLGRAQCHRLDEHRP